MAEREIPQGIVRHFLAILRHSPICRLAASTALLDVEIKPIRGRSGCALLQIVRNCPDKQFGGDVLQQWNQRASVPPSGIVSASRGIYLDHHATTPVDPEVAQAVVRCMVEDFGNANSTDHTYGEHAAESVENARESVAGLLSAGSEDIHFTAGSTQAIELAFAHAIGAGGPAPLRVALSRVEHPAVIDTAVRAERRGLASLRWLEVSGEGEIDLDELRAAVKDADLLCMMAANNEIGTIYPVASAFDIAEGAGVRMLVDATQAVGRTELDLSTIPFDYLVLSGHKIYGPKGVGALVSASYRPEENHGISASHEPTQNVPGIVGLGLAARIMSERGARTSVGYPCSGTTCWSGFDPACPAWS
ncbi:aminotransferase class V-fold PLP-dependent enzyme (plasmid) [Devosia neptuniae]|uniref:cysteine desulfurase n=1 Tax=Devosia neptuniae TaxID=191302 RepID=A0ABY6C6R6_9HYPH|nr:aminotransferase class V-fold PLP-dependent enzyme [Devosia neptuniae]UXN67939.1 aminotransferase class V-fold PLP-dependent enzyme [Devosia neptuniae]